MRPDDHIAAAAEKAALLVAREQGEQVVDYRQLCDRSIALAAFLQSLGVRKGDTVAILLENRCEVAEAAWAAQRSGLRYTLINHHLNADEVRYIIEDCDATALITSSRLVALVAATGLPALRVRLVMDADAAGFDRYENIFPPAPARPCAARGGDVEGTMMLYSSGTTGRPKGIRYDHPRQNFGEQDGTAVLLRDSFGMAAGSVLLLAGPLYHAAPISWAMAAHRLGASVIALEKYDPLECLRMIEQHGVTHVLMVPTHFVRMLKLDDEERGRYSPASLRCVVHAAAPCPVDVKERMLDWWGPIIHEFYSSTEANGFVLISPQEWLTHKGSVGRVTHGRIHIADDNGQPLGVGEAGTVWFESAGTSFTYHKDEQKSRAAYDASGRSTVGDIGYLDADGYLYLTDRKANMIISGGVNIYPQEIENLLALHPAVRDIAVIGVPHPDFGEEVLAVVVPTDPTQAGNALAEELIAHCRARIAHFKCPRRVRFIDALPRSAAGKLVKRLIR